MLSNWRAKSPAEGIIIIGREWVGTVTCKMLDQSVSGKIVFTSIEIKGDLDFEWIISYRHWFLITRNCGITNVKRVNRLCV